MSKITAAEAMTSLASTFVDQQVLVPITKVERVPLDGEDSQHFAGSFYLSKDEQTLLEVRLYSTSYIAIIVNKKGLQPKIIASTGVPEARKLIEVKLGL